MENTIYENENFGAQEVAPTQEERSWIEENPITTALISLATGALLGGGTVGGIWFWKSKQQKEELADFRALVNQIHELLEKYNGKYKIEMMTPEENIMLNSTKGLMSVLNAKAMERGNEGVRKEYIELMNEFASIIARVEERKGIIKRINEGSIVLEPQRGEM